jgi:hypothetical protein
MICPECKNHLETKEFLNFSDSIDHKCGTRIKFKNKLIAQILAISLVSIVFSELDIPFKSAVLGFGLIFFLFWVSFTIVKFFSKVEIDKQSEEHRQIDKVMKWVAIVFFLCLVLRDVIYLQFSPF